MVSVISRDRENPDFLKEFYYLPQQNPKWGETSCSVETPLLCLCPRKRIQRKHTGKPLSFQPPSSWLRSKARGASGQPMRKPEWTGHSRSQWTDSKGKRNSSHLCIQRHELTSTNKTDDELGKGQSRKQTYFNFLKPNASFQMAQLLKDQTSLFLPSSALGSPETWALVLSRLLTDCVIPDQPLPLSGISSITYKIKSTDRQCLRTLNDTRSQIFIIQAQILMSVAALPWNL